MVALPSVRASPGMLPLLLALAGCGLLDADVRHFDEPRTYEHALFESPEACQAAQPPDFHLNCSQWMDFEPDGRVAVVVTDIINPGRYEIRDDRVTLSMESTPELPARLEMALSDDESRLVEVETGRVWTRVPPGA